ncbi:hypothetical protein QK276_01465 [Treponema pallidum]|nr:hypothetical protein QK276_01465 [Treponema pallidum]
MGSVMSTIPIIFNEKNVAHTVVGGQLCPVASAFLGAVVLNRGVRWNRAEFFAQLTTLGIAPIVSVERSAAAPDVTGLAERFPFVKFITPLECISVGEMINLGVAELDVMYVLVLWSDMRIDPQGMSQHIQDILRTNTHMCIAPQLCSSHSTVLPTQIVPALRKSDFFTQPTECTTNHTPTIYPYDFVGIYHRDRFIQCGGFDFTIANAYWQNLDFGLRSYLWGECIEVNTQIRLFYEALPPQEDASADGSYRIFYLKNLAPLLEKDRAFISGTQFFSFFRNSGLHLIEAYRLFRDAQKWVAVNRYRFKKTAARLVSEWEPR